jgi:hypothetical protein
VVEILGIVQLWGLDLLCRRGAILWRLLLVDVVLMTSLGGVFVDFALKKCAAKKLFDHTQRQLIRLTQDI